MQLHYCIIRGFHHAPFISYHLYHYHSSHALLCCRFIFPWPAPFPLLLCVSLIPACGKKQIPPKNDSPSVFHCLKQIKLLSNFATFPWNFSFARKGRLPLKNFFVSFNLFIHIIFDSIENTTHHRWIFVACSRISWIFENSFWEIPENAIQTSRAPEVSQVRKIGVRGWGDVRWGIQMAQVPYFI